MADVGRISVVFFRTFLSTAERAGVDPSRLLTELGIDPKTLDDPDASIPADVALRLFDEAPRRAGDDAFGLHAAETSPPGAFEVLDYATRSSRTAGEALARVTRYYALVHEYVEIRVHVEGDVGRVTHRMLAPLMVPRHAVELLFAAMVIRGRQFTGRAWPLHSVGFVHSAPSDTSEHLRIFGAPVRFDQPIDELRFDRAWLETPLATADPALSSMLDRYADSLLAKIPRDDGLVEQARRAIAESLRGGDASDEGTASRLHMSARTLQRRLRALGTSHQELVDGVRRDLAVRYLVNERIAVGEVAYLLGYSDPTTFHRAFKRWTGRTPHDYRSNPRARS